MARAGLRKKGKVAQTSHEGRVAHRAAEAKWVKKNKKRHQKAARDYYHRNRAKVLAQRKVAKTSKHRAAVASKRRKYGGSRGRPREG